MLSSMLSMHPSIICKSLCTFENKILQRQKGFLCTLALSLNAEKAGLDSRTIHVTKDKVFAEVKELPSKIQNINHENGVCQAPTLFFRVKKLSDKAVLPSRASLHSAGYDLSSAAETKVLARSKAMIPTDLSIAIPEGTYARIAPRSGLAWKNSIDVGAGVIDADYRGPIGVILFNHSDLDFEVKVGDRIAQLIIEKIITPDVQEVEDLDSTERASCGFGSTGI